MSGLFPLFLDRLVGDFFKLGNDLFWEQGMEQFLVRHFVSFLF